MEAPVVKSNSARRSPRYSIPVFVPTVVQKVALEFYDKNPRAQIYMPTKVGKSSILVEQVKRDVIANEKEAKREAEKTLLFQHNRIRLILVAESKSPKMLIDMRQKMTASIAVQTETARKEGNPYVTEQDYCLLVARTKDELEYCVLQAERKTSIWVYIDDEHCLSPALRRQIFEFRDRFTKIRMIGGICRKKNKGTSVGDELTWRLSGFVQEAEITD